MSGGGGSRCSSASSDPAIDLIGPSELPSSWPMTRIRRCQAWRSSSRSGRLTSDSTSRSWRWPPRRNVVRRTSQRPTPPRHGEIDDRAAPRRTSRSRPAPPAVRPSSCSAARPSSRSPVRLTRRRRCSGSKAKHRDVDLLHHRAQQRRRLDRAQPLLVQRLGQRVDLGHRRRRADRRPTRCGRGSRSRPRAAPRAGWPASAAA